MIIVCRIFDNNVTNPTERKAFPGAKQRAPNFAPFSLPIQKFCYWPFATATYTSCQPPWYIMTLLAPPTPFPSTTWHFMPTPFCNNITLHASSTKTLTLIGCIPMAERVRDLADGGTLGDLAWRMPS